MTPDQAAELIEIAGHCRLLLLWIVIATVLVFIWPSAKT